MKHRFEKYCKDIENVENYEKAKANDFVGWCCHHRLETHTSDGKRRLVDIRQKELIALGMYYNRPAEELIFMKHSEHSSLHKPSDNTKKKLRAANKGENNPFYGKRHSEEAKKKMSASKKGKHWYNNDKENKLCYECPDGFTPGRLK